MSREIIEVDLIIEKNIPIAKRGRYEKEAETISKMEIGDSFVYKYTHLKITRVGAYQRLRNLARRMGVKIVSRKCGEEMRIWRVE